MPTGNQAQRRQASAQKQRDQAKKKREQPKPQQEQGQQQRGQTQADQPQQGEAHQQRPTQVGWSNRYYKLGEALEDLRKYDLLTEPEAEEMQKVHGSNEGTAQQGLMASVFERIQVFLKDASKSSKQRRQVRNAKEIIQYHVEMQTTGRAQEQFDKLQIAQRQSEQAASARAASPRTDPQNLQQPPGQARQQPRQAREPQSPDRQQRRQAQAQRALINLPDATDIAEDLRLVVQELISLGALQQREVPGIVQSLASFTGWPNTFRDLEKRIDEHVGGQVGERRRSNARAILHNITRRLREAPETAAHFVEQEQMPRRPSPSGSAGSSRAGSEKHDADKTRAALRSPEKMDMARLLGGLQELDLLSRERLQGLREPLDSPVWDELIDFAEEALGTYPRPGQVISGARKQRVRELQELIVHIRRNRASS